MCDTRILVAAITHACVCLVSLCNIESHLTPFFWVVKMALIKEVVSQVTGFVLISEVVVPLA